MMTVPRACPADWRIAALTVMIAGLALTVRGSLYLILRAEDAGLSTYGLVGFGAFAIAAGLYLRYFYKGSRDSRSSPCPPV